MHELMKYTHHKTLLLLFFKGHRRLMSEGSCIKGLVSVTSLPAKEPKDTDYLREISTYCSLHYVCQRMFFSVLCCILTYAGKVN